MGLIPLPTEGCIRVLITVFIAAQKESTFYFKNKAHIPPPHPILKRRWVVSPAVIAGPTTEYATKTSRGIHAIHRQCILHPDV